MSEACTHMNITSMQERDKPAMHVCTDCAKALSAKEARAEYVSNSAVANVFGTAILDALKIDKTMVVSLSLNVDAGFVPILKIERAILSDDAVAICKVVEQYQLIPRPSDPRVDSQESTGSN